MINKRNTKSQPVEYRQVHRAYQSLKNNGKAAGVDGLSMEDFEKDKEKLLYKIWNRMTSGSYFPPPIRAVDISKKDGGVRTLGIPTVSDRIAQMVVKHAIEPRLEKIFHEDSYSYRPKRSAHDALKVTRERCINYDWVIDLDIKGFFDNINHELLEKCLTKHIEEKWILLYINRWLKAPFVNKTGKIIPRNKGASQGGVISPLLANLFLHYVFDEWMSKYYADIKFERYADDIIVHCRSKKQGQFLLSKINKRLNDCFLSLHPDKTKLIYCKDYKRKDDEDNVSFTFLSHTFKPRKYQSKYGKGFFLGFGPALSMKVQKAKILELKTLYQEFFSIGSLKGIALHINAKIRGWINYYGRAHLWALKPIFNALNFRLAKWLKRSHKRFKYSLGYAFKYLKKLCRFYPDLFAHWERGFTV